MENPLVVDTARPPQTILHAVVQVGQTPLRGSDANDRKIQVSTFCHCIERREDPLVGKIAGDAKQDQCVGVRAPCRYCSACQFLPMITPS